MSICDDPSCWGADRPHEHLSMPDPCPHVSRLELISARLHGVHGELLDHIAACPGKPGQAVSTEESSSKQVTTERTLPAMGIDHIISSGRPEGAPTLPERTEPVFSTNTSAADDGTNVGTSTVIQLPGGRHIDYTAVLERTFRQNADGIWLDLDERVSPKGIQYASPQQQHFYAMANAKGVEPITGEERRRVNWLSPTALVADTTDWSDLSYGKLPALWQPDDMHVLYVANPNALSGRPVAYRILIQPTEWRPRPNERVASMYGHTYRLVYGFRSIEEALDDLEAVKAAVYANVLAHNPVFQSDDDEDDVPSAEDTYGSLSVEDDMDWENQSQ